MILIESNNQWDGWDTLFSCFKTDKLEWYSERIQTSGMAIITSTYGLFTNITLFEQTSEKKKLIVIYVLELGIFTM